MSEQTRSIPVIPSTSKSIIPTVQYRCVANNDLQQFQDELNSLFDLGWEAVVGSLTSCVTSHTMPGELFSSDKEGTTGDRKYRRYTQANFICIVRLLPGV